MNIILYSTHCPRCNVITKKLNDKNIKYIEVNDIEEITSKGYKSVPILEIDGNPLQFAAANDWINKYTED